MAKRKRATCIVELLNEQGEPCVLIAKQKGDNYDMVPGGRVDRGEPPIVAAIRELREESTLKTSAVVKLFDHESQHTHHSVFLILTEGSDYQPRDDVEQLWLLPLAECHRLDEYPQLSRSTKVILSQYIQWRGDKISAVSLAALHS